MDEDLPLLLIPSSWPISFILVFKDSLKLYNIPRKGNRGPKTYRIGSSTQGQLWVQWQKSVRRHYYLQNSDDFYLCREDGMLQYFEVSVKPELDIQLHFRLSHLEGCKVDSAFALLSTLDATGEPSKHDVVLVGGDLTNGGFYSIYATSEAQKKQEFLNWAPIRDFQILPDAKLNTESDMTLADRCNRLLVAGGNASQTTSEVQAANGKLSLLKYAFEASVVLRVSLQTEGGDHGSLVDSLLADKLYILQDNPSSRNILLISSPERTAIIQFPFSLQENLDASEWSDLNLVSEAPTLAAGSDGQTRALQVTRDVIKILFLSSDTPSAVDGLCFGSPVIAAAVDESGSLVLVATKTSSGFQLRSYEVTEIGQSPPMREITDAMDLSSDPKSLFITRLDGHIIVLVGFNMGLLEVYEISAEEKFLPLCFQKISSTTANAEEDSIDSVVLLRPSTDKALVVLCGMRNGWLVCMALQTGNKNNAGALGSDSHYDVPSS